jgi:hypothetical protein
LDVGVGEVETGVDSELEAGAEVVPAVDVDSCVTVESAGEEGGDETGAEVDCWLVGAAVEDDESDGVVEAGKLGVLVTESVDVTTVSVVTAVLVTTVPFPELVACLFANSIKLSATSAFCRCRASTAVLSSWNTPC